MLTRTKLGTLTGLSAGPVRPIKRLENILQEQRVLT